MSFEGSRAVLIKDLSGNTLNVVDGSLSATASVSGQTIRITNASGFNAVYLTTASGNVAVATTSTDSNLGTTTRLHTASLILGLDDSGPKYNTIRTTASGSALSQNGVEYRLKTDAVQAGSVVRSAPWTVCTAASGGTALGSGIVVHGVKLTNVGTVISGDLFVGGTDTNAPFSGQGYYLRITENMELRVQNLNQVRACATVSGVRVAFVGIDY